MRRRASGSGAEDDDGLAPSPTPKSTQTNNADKSKGRDIPMDTFDEAQAGLKEKPRRRSAETATTATTSSKFTAWNSSRQSLDKTALGQIEADTGETEAMADYHRKQHARLRSPWSCSPVTLSCTAISLLLLFVIVQSFLSRQLDPKGCAMSYMAPAFAKFTDFDTEHTRFASKYSLYLYREGGIDTDTRVSSRGELWGGQTADFDRSKGYPYFSSQETPVATSRYAQWLQEQHTTGTTYCSTTRLL